MMTYPLVERLPLPDKYNIPFDKKCIQRLQGCQQQISGLFMCQVSYQSINVRRPRFLNAMKTDELTVSALPRQRACFSQIRLSSRRAQYPRLQTHSPSPVLAVYQCAYGFV